MQNEKQPTSRVIIDIYEDSFSVSVSEDISPEELFTILASAAKHAQEMYDEYEASTLHQLDLMAFLRSGEEGTAMCGTIVVIQ